MPDLNVKEFAERDALDRALAADVRDRLAKGVSERGHGALAVSGGSTPLGFFRELASLSLEWSQVSITLVDERWVPPTHEDSNERLLRDRLLIGAAAAATLIPLFSGEATPEAAEQPLSEALAKLGTFDAVVLGMGGDGHTASLFPGSAALPLGLDLDSGRSCLAVHPLTAPHARMSLTLPRFLDCRRLLLHITGDEKRAVLERARTDDDPLALPIAAVLHSAKPALCVFWAP